MHRAYHVWNNGAEAGGPDRLARPVHDPSSIWREPRRMSAPGGDELPWLAARHPHDIDAAVFAFREDDGSTVWRERRFDLIPRIRRNSERIAPSDRLHPDIEA